jgi:hypothetical protein
MEMSNTPQKAADSREGREGKCHTSHVRVTHRNVQPSKLNQGKGDERTIKSR